VASPDEGTANQSKWRIIMSRVSTARITPRHRRLHTAFGTVAVSLATVATIAVGAHTIGVAPAADYIPTFCPAAAQCQQQQTPVGPDLEAPLVHRHPLR